ncbi:unnamed protein product [Mytilus coruscus]|uniref:Ig-like domain-containing protein n=1 Tax=Mytilus coruscus TaxID=42192 RepID=A0A6J8E5S3_MYTCO|nr:unnamed protein product [Mytilus coruscus]
MGKTDETSRSLSGHDTGNNTCLIYLPNQNYKEWHQESGSLTVQTAPYIWNHRVASITVQEGQNITPGGTYTVFQIEATGRGEFICIADNNIKPPASYTVQLEVRVSPYVIAVEDIVSQAQNRRFDAKLECLVAETMECQGQDCPSVRAGKTPSAYQVFMITFMFGLIISFIFAVRPEIVDDILPKVKKLGQKAYLNLVCNKFKASITVAPTIKDGSAASITVQEGQNITLTCEANGNPAPNITRKRGDGFPLPNGGIQQRYYALLYFIINDIYINCDSELNTDSSTNSDNDLNNTAVTALDDTLFGTSDHQGLTTEEIPLEHKDVADKTVFAVRPEIVDDVLPEVKKQGQTAYLNFSVINLQSPAQLQWIKQTTPTGLPQHISSGETVRIDEVVEGRRKYDVVKYRTNNHDIYQLIIRSLTETDAGNYRCQIYLPNQNYMEWPKKLGRLTVQIAPTIKAASAASITVQEGQNITLYCEANGNPAPNITWKRGDGFPLPNGRFQQRIRQNKNICFSSQLH